MRIYKLVGIVLSALLLLVSCTNSDVDKKKVKIAYAIGCKVLPLVTLLR